MRGGEGQMGKEEGRDREGRWEGRKIGMQLGGVEERREEGMKEGMQLEEKNLEGMMNGKIEGA